VSSEAGNGAVPPADRVPGLTNPRALSLARFPIRTRGDEATRSAWRLAVACEEGEGAVVLVEASAAETFYRGEGILLGWAQDRLASAYRALLPEDGEPTFELHQLG
jgi:hypothetical protein